MGSSSSVPQPSTSTTTTTQTTVQPATDVVSDATAVFKDVVSDATDVVSDATAVFKLLLMNQEITASSVDRIRTALDHSVRGRLSTFSPKHEVSMVRYACDADGSVIIAFTSLSVHTGVLVHHPKCVLLVACEDISSDDLIITVHGDAVLVAEDDRELVHSAYLRKHPGAESVEGDFRFIRIVPKVVQYTYGVGMESGEFSSEEFKNGKVDLMLSADLLLLSAQLD